MPRAFHMLGALAVTPMAEASAETPPATSMARSSGVTAGSFDYHVRDSTANTNVMQDADPITCVKSLAERLKWARDQKEWTQEELAKAASVSQGTIGNAESGTRKAPRELLAIARALGVSPDWLKTGKGSAKPVLVATNAGAEIDLTDNADYPAIRRVLFKLSAGASGFGVEYLNDEDTPIVFGRAWFDSRGYNPGKLFAVRVVNGSMQPYLNEGDTVVVNTADSEPKDGVVFAVNYEGELVIKRVVRDEGQWWLSSDNPDQRRYPRKACSESCLLLGRIVHKQSEHI